MIRLFSQQRGLVMKKPPKQISPLLRKEARAAHLFMIPAYLGLSFITYIPLIAAFALGFFDWRVGMAPKFVGLENFAKLFTTDPYFIDSIGATSYYAVLAVIGSLVYSLGIALLLNRRIPARGFWRAVFYVPYILPGTAIYIAWNFLYQRDGGLINIILGGFGVAKTAFMNSSSTVIPALALIAVWTAGNLIVIFLAGLQNVPRVYIEAAEIDGANAWQRFWHVTIPNMTPIIFYNLMMSLVTNMQVVTPALAVTKGGPGKATSFITYIMYKYGFVEGRLGYASAVSFMFFIIIAIFTGILFATSKTWIFYEGGDGK